jgi:hypothetical protein
MIARHVQSALQTAGLHVLIKDIQIRRIGQVLQVIQIEFRGERILRGGIVAATAFGNIKTSIS